MSRGDRISVRGRWPGQVQLRQGWSRAQARPWNQDVPSAALRLERGSAPFLAGCVETLAGLGAEGVMTVPLYPSMTGVWIRAGFRPHRDLLLLERPLGSRGEEHRPSDIGEWPRDDWVETVIGIDDDAFGVDWRLGRLGLIEASRATAASAILTDGSPTRAPSGFAIVGVAGTVGYLQRLAVSRSVQGTGVGRRLVMASLRWAGGRGGRSMLVNTQPDNKRSIALYTSMGFVILADRLSVLRAETDVITPYPPEP